MSLFTAFFVGVFGLNASMALAGIISRHLSWGFGIAAGIALGLVIVVYSFKFKRGVLFFCAIYALTGVVLTSMSIRDYRVARGGGIADGISVREAPDHPAAGGYRFRDAVLKPDIRGQVLTTHTDINGQRTSRWYYVAAVVPENWTSAEPIAVWAACGEIASCRENWAKPFQAGLRLNPETTSIPDYRQAAAQAEAVNGVASAPQPLFITWVGDVEAAISKNRTDAFETAKIWNIVWLANVLFVWVFSLVKKRKAERTPQGGAPPSVS
jgi:hypothetical protein